MEAARQFRKVLVRATAVLTIVAALASYPLSPVVAQSLALGGFAGLLVFWILARRLEKVATMPQDKIHFHSFQSTSLKIGVYLLVLYTAYALDPVAGLLAALGGLCIVHVVAIFLVFSGFGSKQENG